MIFNVRKSVAFEEDEFIFYIPNDREPEVPLFVAFLAITIKRHQGLGYRTEILPGSKDKLCLAHESDSHTRRAREKLKSMPDYLIQLYEEYYG